MSLTHEECLAHLEKLRWNKTPTCPYCDSIKATRIKDKHRYHCNSCFTSYSVTVKTMFHRTRISLDKWFLAIYTVKNQKRISIRKLARIIQVNKNSASTMRARIYHALDKNPEFLASIAKFVKQSLENKEGNNL